MDGSEPVNLAAALDVLQPKQKAPGSARVLDAWIAQAERRLGSDGGRLGWLVASTVVAAALQQVVDEQGEPLFLLKDGTLLQHRLPRFSRATTDLDGLIRETGTPAPSQVKAAIIDIFAARAHDAVELGYPERAWPTRITAYPHWAASYERAAASAGMVLTLEDAVAQVNPWLGELDAS